MTVEIVPAPLSEKAVLRNLMELYQYDFSAFEPLDVDRHGLFGYPYLDHYWTEPDRHPFLLRAGYRWVGFALVNAHTHLPGSQRSIAEFFLLRRYRGQGLGRAVAHRLLDRFPGVWEVQVSAGNAAAQQFWNRTVEAYTGGRYLRVEHHEGWKGVIYQLSSGGHSPPEPA